MKRRRSRHGHAGRPALCGVCGERSTVTGYTTDGRAIRSCGDAVRYGKLSRKEKVAYKRDVGKPKRHRHVRQWSGGIG